MTVSLITSIVIKRGLTTRIMEQEEQQAKWETLWETVKDTDEGKHDPLISGILGFFVLIFSTILGTIANILAFRYFLTKSNIFFNAFKIVALCDVFICQLSTFYGVSLLAGRAPLMFANSIFCNLWSYLWRMLYRFSLHLVAIQCVLRTVKICRPLQVLPKHILTMVLSLDLVLIIGIIISNSRIFSPIFDGIYASCLRNSFKQTYESPNLRTVRLALLALFSFAGSPFLIILTCCALCSMKLVGQKSATIGRTRDLARHRSYSITSLLFFSLTGFVLNLPALGDVFFRILYLGSINERHEGVKTWLLLYGYLIFREICVTINSIINPFIFLWRMTELRKNIYSTVLEPIFAAYIHYRGKKATHESIEPATIKTNYCNTKKNLKNNPENDGKLQNRTDDFPINIAGENDLSNSVTLHRTQGDKARSHVQTSSLEQLHMDNVIVHRNAVDHFERELLREISYDCELDSESCECECCFFERDGVKNFNFDKDLLGAQNIVDL